MWWAVGLCSSCGSQEEKNAWRRIEGPLVKVCSTAGKHNLVLQYWHSEKGAYFINIHAHIVTGERSYIIWA